MKILNYVLVAHAPHYYYYYYYNNSESSHWRAIFRTHTHTHISTYIAYHHLTAQTTMKWMKKKKNATRQTVRVWCEINVQEKWKMNVRFPWQTRWMWNVIHATWTMMAKCEIPELLSDIISIVKSVWWERKRTPLLKSRSLSPTLDFLIPSEHSSCVFTWLWCIWTWPERGIVCICVFSIQSVVASSIKTVAFNNFVVFLPRVSLARPRNAQSEWSICTLYSLLFAGQCTKLGWAGLGWDGLARVYAVNIYVFEFKIHGAYSMWHISPRFFFFLRQHNRLHFYAQQHQQHQQQL